MEILNEILTGKPFIARGFSLEILHLIATLLFFFQINLKELIVIVLSSVALTLTFEMPFINIKSAFVKRKAPTRIQRVSQKAD